MRQSPYCVITAVYKLFMQDLKNYFGYLNKISATPSCAPIKNPFGNGGKGFEAMTARSAALVINSFAPRLLKLLGAIRPCTSERICPSRAILSCTRTYCVALASFNIGGL